MGIPIPVWEQLLIVNMGVSLDLFAFRERLSWKNYKHGTRRPVDQLKRWNYQEKFEKVVIILQVYLTKIKLFIFKQKNCYSKRSYRQHHR